MTAVIIKQKDVERLGKEVLKEMNDFLHDEYILSEFEEMKKEQEKFLKNLAKEGDGIDTEGIFHTLNSLNLNMELNEDLYFKTKAFLDIFKVFDFAYTYLDE